MTNGMARWTGMAALAALALGGCARQTPEQQAEAIMNKDPSVARFMAAMKETFPDDYHQFVATAVANAKAGMPADQAKASGFAITQSLIARHQRDIVRAPDADVVKVITAQGTALTKLDETACAHVFMVGLQPTDTFPDAAKPAFADVSIANLRAARAGMDHPTERPTQPAPADIKALEAQMRAHGLNDAQVGLFERGGLPSASPHDQCAVGRAVTAATGSLPTATGARIATVFLSAVH
jgi:hypothetical protein